MPKGRILAVDDQRYFRELLENMLTEVGFDVQTASSGEEALRVLEHASFDILLTDLVMPQMDGNELVVRVKQRDPDQDIVVITGVVDVKTAVDAMKSGASEYLLKPFERETLANTLEGVLHRRRLRVEHARLLAENIEYMGERTLIDRAMALFSFLSVEPLAERIVDGLCVETGAQAGVLWIAGKDDGGAAPLTLASARGLVRMDEEPEELAIASLNADFVNGLAHSIVEPWGRGEQDRSRASHGQGRRRTLRSSRSLVRGEVRGFRADCPPQRAALRGSRAPLPRGRRRHLPLRVLPGSGAQRDREVDSTRSLLLDPESRAASVGCSTAPGGRGGLPRVAR
jgi:FixJ family two-component response regulator